MLFGGCVGCSGCGSLVNKTDILKGLCGACRHSTSICTSLHCRTTAGLDLRRLEHSRRIINEIMPRLFLGDLCAATNKTVLTKFGITHLVDASGHNHVRVPSISYHEVHVVDTDSANIKDHFEASNRFIHDALVDPDSQVLVHCFRGVSRSATLILAYLLRQDVLGDRTLDELLAFVRESRAAAYPNRGFWKQLKQFEAEQDPGGVKCKDHERSCEDPGVLCATSASRNECVDEASQAPALCKKYAALFD